MLGHKSIVKSMDGGNLIIQANKNFGICDILIDGKRFSEALSIFQGRQYNDGMVLEDLLNYLSYEKI